VTWHSLQLCYGRLWTVALRGQFIDVTSYPIVPAFFALSGVLVANSMVRVAYDIRIFLTLRTLRIFPALAVEISLSALILGPRVTTFELGAYFNDGTRWGFVHFQLPGVFLDNPIPNVVNGQLWTVPSELRCYIALAVLMVTRISRQRWLMLGAFAIIAVAECGLGFMSGHQYTARSVTVFGNAGAVLPGG
jgi:peptidoglycan/LPS O-acetylase OafA/YrhL